VSGLAEFGTAVYRSAKTWRSFFCRNSSAENNEVDILKINIKHLINIFWLRQTIKFVTFFRVLLLKQSFLKTTDQQSPAIQQFEETIYQFLYCTTSVKQSELKIAPQNVHLLL